MKYLGRWTTALIGVAFCALLAMAGVAAIAVQSRDGGDSVSAAPTVAQAEYSSSDSVPTTQPDTTEQDIASLRQKIPELSYSQGRYLVTVCFPLPDAHECFARFLATSFPPTYTPPSYTPPTYTPPSYTPPTYYGPTIPYAGNGGGPTLCGDGSVSNSSGSGTCSHHGGISD